jgi:hypothetical protein
VSLRFFERFFNYLALLIEVFLILSLYLGLGYLLIVGKTTLTAALFFAILSFFMFVLPAILSLRMPFSVGIFYLLLGSGGILTTMDLPAKYLFLGSLLLFLAGFFLLLGFFTKKLTGKGK